LEHGNICEERRFNHQLNADIIKIGEAAMPGKLIAFILTLLVIVTFIGFNIDNSSDIRVWFGENGVLKDVPIFVSFFIMYLIGVLSVVPFIVGWKFRKKPIAKPEDSESDDEADSGKKKVRVLGARKRRKKSAEKEDTDIDGADVENGEEGNEAVSDVETPPGVDLS
jgi:hypothetical protein